jgi:hypothetical protein
MSFSKPDPPALPPVASVPKAPPPPPLFGANESKPQSAPKGKPFAPTFLGAEAVPSSQQLGVKTLLGAA